MTVRRRPMNRLPGRGGRRGGGMRLVMALVMAVIALISFFGSRSFNPVTNEDQYISLTPNQEIAMGLQAAPKMIQQYGGLVPDERLQGIVDQVGFKLVRESIARETDWEFEFHLLNDPETINAFALPGGQVFITTALFNQLETEGQLAGVLGHEIGHVVARHSAQQIAKSELTQGLIGAVATAADDGDGGAGAARIAAMVGQLINMKFGREDELQADNLGVRIIAEAGYDPRSLIGVMDILESTGGGGPPEFFSTHPNPENRRQHIRDAIAKYFPNGVPDGLIP